MMRNRANLALIALLTLSCAHEGDDLSLAGSSGELEEILQRRLAITVQPGPANFTGAFGPGWQCTVDGCDAAGLMLAVQYGCEAELATLGLGRPIGACADEVIAAELEMCTANTMLRIVEDPRGSNVTLAAAGKNPGTAVFPPQDAESNYDIARVAIDRAVRASRVAGAAMASSACTLTLLRTPSGTTPELAALTLLDRLAHFQREGAEAALRGADDMALAAAAVSDSMYSESTDTAAASDAIASELVSRTAAAHVLVGGELGLPALRNPERGFFSHSRLSAEAQAALELLRIAAIDPALIASDSIDIDHLVLDSTAPSSGLAMRIGLMQANERLLAATSARAVYEILGISSQGFVEARTHLREELRAFDRSLTMELDPEELADGTSTDGYGIDLFAATRTPPRPLLPAYWAAVVRHDTTPSPMIADVSPFPIPGWQLMPTSSGAVAPGFTYGDESTATYPTTVTGFRSVASLYPELHERSDNVLERLLALEADCSGTEAAIAACVADLERAEAIVAGIYDQLSGTVDGTGTGATVSWRYDSAEYLGQARACWYQVDQTYNNVHFEVTGPIVDQLVGEPLVVAGHDGLDCAVRGEIEGVPCTPARLASLTPTQTWDNDDPGDGLVHFGTVFGLQPQVGPDARPRAGVVPLFIVTRRLGAAGNPPGPGGWDPAVGFILESPDEFEEGFRYCQTAPITPELDRYTARLVEPSRRPPFQSSESCAGVAVDQLIPLENELTDDGNGIESSWQHYLQLARAAADEADTLGDQLVRTGLEMDLRGEAAADELNRLCGVSINVSSLREDLAAEPAIDGGAPPCTLPYVDRGGICVRDPMLFAAEQAGYDDTSGRLASCLGADTVPWATFGNTRLCIWDTTPSSPGGICEGANPMMPCPRELASGAPDCDGAGPTPSGVEWIAVDRTIGLFERPPDPAPPSPPDPNDLPCAELARAREGVATDEDLDRIWRSPLMRFESFRPMADSLSWEAQVGDFSAVRYAGTPVFRTGVPSSPSSSPTSPWPMGDFVPQGTVCPDSTYWDSTMGRYRTSAATADLSTYQGSLFCLGGLRNGTPQQRARFNNLLGRAAFAARVLTGTSLSRMVFPFSQGASLHEFRVENAYDNPVNTSTGVLCADVADVRIDNDSDDCCDGSNGPYIRPLADLGERACTVPGTCGQAASVEWTHSPYRDAVQYPQDDACANLATGGGGGGGRLILGPPGDAFTRPGAVGEALEIWPWLRDQVYSAGDRLPGDLHHPLLAASGTRARYQDRVDGFTSYWSRDCHQGYFPGCIDDGAMYGWSGNNAAFEAVTLNDWINGVELACVAARQSEPSILTSACGDRPEVASIVDAFRAASFLECQAAEIQRYASESVMANVPERVVTALEAQASGDYGNGAGEFDGQVSDIRGAIIDMANARIAMAEDTRRIAARIRALRAQISTHQRAGTIEDLLTTSNILGQALSCAVASANAATLDTNVATNITLAATTCATAGAQTGIAIAINQLRHADIDDAIITQFATFDEGMADFGERMSGHNLTIRSSLERLDGAMARLRATQGQARRALARALLLEDDGTDVHYGATAVYRGIYNTALVRYQRAHNRARRAAFIARRAVEQRIGMSLHDIEGDVFSGESPHEWVDRLCRMPAIDYDRLRAGSSASPDGGVGSTTDVLPPDDYSGAYVGDYVDQLEGILESYNFVYPFREGTDTAVISLRDDVFQTRAPCPVESLNLLHAGGNLRQRESTTRAGWRMTGCGAASAGPCLGVSAIDELAAPNAEDLKAPVPGSRFDLGWPRPYRLSFGVDGAAGATRLEQHLVVGPGRYRISWYARPGSLTSATLNEVVDVQTTTGSSLVTEEGYTPLVANGWSRVWAFVTLATEEEIVVVIHDNSSSVVSGTVDLAGVMFEDVSDTTSGVLTMAEGQANSPPPWMDTGAVDRRVCPDTTGMYFRSETWRPGCVRVCPDGYDGRCSDDVAAQRCYREATLGISSDALQRLLVGRPAGFAGGNYNYRIESAAVNLVGTNLRDCSGLGAGCYSSGNLSYSMLHSGPFLFRDARGSWFESLLFPGRMESARALSAERYITNPISSADLALIQPYTRAELAGRPLAGTLHLRLWDEPGFRFDRLEDVQIVLTYRYWQHQR